MSKCTQCIGGFFDPLPVPQLPQIISVSNQLHLQNQKLINPLQTALLKTITACKRKLTD